jgi:hypothetical protein
MSADCRREDIDERGWVAEREVSTPAVLALYPEDILTQACKDVLAGTT